MKRDTRQIKQTHKQNVVFSRALVTHLQTNSRNSLKADLAFPLDCIKCIRMIIGTTCIYFYLRNLAIAKCPNIDKQDT